MLDYMHVGTSRISSRIASERRGKALSESLLQNSRLEEERHLEHIISIASQMWKATKERLKSEEAEISLAYEEMLENATHDLKRRNSEQGFHNLVNLSQYIMPVTAQVVVHESGVLSIRALEGMMESPYFARIDFHYQGDETPEKIYIGRATLLEKSTYTIHVYDWRTPVASVFYRYGLGPASFQAPNGIVHGDVLLKRQYEIHHGKLQYFFDADVQILDEFLRQLLSKSASSKMKTIVETIQRDQDIVIRDMENDVLMVQGAAGSGKTSIALHRIAYLMYQGLNGRLNANDILILSPNSVFEEYISHVLPDLGEKNVKTLLFEDVFHRILPGIPLLSKSRCTEQLLACEDDNQTELIKHSSKFKGSGAFVEMLNRMVFDLPKNWIPFADVDYSGQCVAHKEALRSEICNPKKIAPLGMRLKWMERAILDKVHDLKKARIHKLTRFASRYPEHAMEIEAFARWLSIRESAIVLCEIRKFSQLDAVALYKALFGNKQRFYRLANGLTLPEDIELIRQYTFDRLNTERIWHDDAQAILYLHTRIHGYGDFMHYRQVVLDEAQDESPLYFSLLHELFTGARYTILGDVNQTIGKQEDLSLYQHIKTMLGREKALLVTMEKSFRCTMEIWRFSTRFLAKGMTGQCFSRSGEEPQIHQAANESAMINMLVDEVSTCQEKGFHSIALITKTEQDAQRLNTLLSARLHLRLVNNGDKSDIRGVVILPIYLAKGLEFDAVLIVDTDKRHYHTADDKGLLYIACTRALHRLNLFYTGSISPLLV